MFSVFPRCADDLVTCWRLGLGVDRAVGCRAVLCGWFGGSYCASCGAEWLGCVCCALVGVDRHLHMHMPCPINIESHSFTSENPNTLQLCTFIHLFSSFLLHVSHSYTPILQLIPALIHSIPPSLPIVVDTKQLDCQTEAFGGVAPLPQAYGYAIVLGFGLLLSLITSILIFVDRRFGGTKVSAEQYTTAGRTVKTGLIADVVCSQWTWAATLLQSSNVAWKYGASLVVWG